MRMSATFSRIAALLLGALVASACTSGPLATPRDNSIIAGGEDDVGSSDLDKDGVPNAEDNCPVNANPGQQDGDHDGVGDVCDDCPNVADPEQPDENDNGQGDACEGQQPTPPPPPDAQPAPPDCGDDICPPPAT